MVSPYGVTLYGVSVSNNLGDGAYIFSRGSISIKNSVFDHNDGTGLNTHDQNVFLDNTQANNNSGMGILNFGTAGIFSANLVTTNNNNDVGLFIDTCGDWDDDTVCNNIFAGSISLGHITSSGNNIGLNIKSSGAVYISNAYFGDNTSSGIYIDNTMSKTSPLIMITNVIVPRNWFGINIESKGPVTIKNFNVYENREDGIRIESCSDWFGHGHCLKFASSSVTLTSDSGTYSETHDNGGNGLSNSGNGYWIKTYRCCHSNQCKQLEQCRHGWIY